MSYGNYRWNCLVYDNRSNFAYASSNFTLFVENITTTLITPTNNTHKNTNETYFNCSSETESTKSLSNITLNLFNSTNSIYNETKNSSGASNSSIFNYNFTSEGRYYWTCRSYNNESELSITGNFTVIFDITKPDISLLDPGDQSSYTADSQTINFGYNVSDNFNVSNCSLIVNGLVNATNNSINNSLTQNFSVEFGSGTFNWNINCSDTAENIANSSTRSITITAPVTTSTTSSGGSGGGGGSIIPTEKTKTFIITKEQALSGYSEKLEKGDKIQFYFYDKKSKGQTLIVNEITNNYVNITINSTITKLLLSVGQSAKINLTNSDYYDIFIKLNSIKDNKADLTIQIINEPIIKTEFPKEVIKKEEVKDTVEKEIKDRDNIIDLKKSVKELKIILGLFVIIIIIIIIIIIQNNMKHFVFVNKKIYEYKEIFNKHVRPRNIKNKQR